MRGESEQLTSSIPPRLLAGDAGSRQATMMCMKFLVEIPLIWFRLPVSPSAEQVSGGFDLRVILVPDLNALPVKQTEAACSLLP